MRRSNKNNTVVYERLIIEKISSEGAGIAYADNKVIFVDKAVPGDECSATSYQKRKKYSKAKIDELFVSSDLRQMAFCSSYNICGGCKLQHLKYSEQAKYKQQSVYDAFERVAKVEVKEKFPILECTETIRYRNKMQYTFSNNRWLSDEEKSGQIKMNKNGLGLHVSNSFANVVNIEKCFLPDNISNRIRNFTKAFCQEFKFKFFDILKQEGLMRNLVTRTSSTGELMLTVIFFENNKEKILQLMKILKEVFPEITSLNYIINQKKSENYSDLEVFNFHGKDYIIEELGSLKFKIRAKSFFQTNSTQANNLYDIVKQFAQLTKEDIVYDLYSGVGSIGLYLADKCNKVVGIEIIDSAIIDAIENAKLNKITNADFFLGDVNSILNKNFIAKNAKPTVLITDPPRIGMQTEVVETILKAEVPKIVYISCNPSTQARDIALLSDKYDVLKIQPVDMFPHTAHIENVALLSLKQVQ